MTNEVDRLERENLALFNLLTRAEDVLMSIFMNDGLRPGAVDCFRDINKFLSDHRRTQGESNAKH